MPLAYRELLVVSARSFPFSSWECSIFSQFIVEICREGGQLGAHLKPKARESLEFFGKEVPIVSSYHRDWKGVLHHVLRMVEVSQEEVIKNPSDDCGCVIFCYF